MINFIPTFRVADNAVGWKISFEETISNFILNLGIRVLQIIFIQLFFFKK